MLKLNKLFKSKKGQGISLNVIVAAAIALIVLVLLSVILMGRMTIFTQESNNCEQKGGECYVNKCPGGYNKLPSSSCYDSDDEQSRTKVCCVRLDI